MSSGRAFGAGAGGLGHGRKFHGDDCGRRRLQRDSKRTRAGLQPNEPKRGCETRRTRTQRNSSRTRAAPRMAVPRLPAGNNGALPNPGRPPAAAALRGRTNPPRGAAVKDSHGRMDHPN